jgi:4-hydroxy-3-polyprenylbenzoate decarboxylase
VRDFLKKDVVITEEVKTEYEIARILHENPKKTVFFENILSHSDFRVVGNLVPTREKVCEAIGTTPDEYVSYVTRAIDNPIEPVVVPGEDRIETSIKKIPILKHFEKDSGRYITSGILAANDPEYKRNVSIHRMLSLDESTFTLRVVERRHLDQYVQSAKERGEPLDVAVAIGVHPAVLFASAYCVPGGYDEFTLASALLGKPLELTKCKNGIEVPANSEIVIEGQILPDELTDEGPFADVTGTYDIVRRQPLLKVTRVTTRSNPIYYALLPSGGEHRMLMGMPREPGIFRSVNEIVKAKNACLTEGGCNWLHGVVSIEKAKEEDAKLAINAAFEGHPSMKHVIIVDEDIDIFNTCDVEYAIATRFQANRDTVIIEGAKGSSLDPSAGVGATTTKVGIDATKPIDGEGYEKAGFPNEK